MYKQFLFFTLLSLLPVQLALPQVQQQWVARYDGTYSQGNRYDHAAGVAIDVLGNVYVTGQSLWNNGFFNYATVKYNSTGVQQWVAGYSGPGTDDATGIALDNSGNIYVTGGSAGEVTNVDFATIKYDPTGVQLWVQIYNGPVNGGDKANAIKVDGSGNVYVTGISTGVGGNYDFVTIKYNTNGVQQWVQRYDGPGNGDDVPYSLALDGSGSVYVTGWSIGSGTGHDFATIKYNSTGVQQWIRRYNGDGNGLDESHSIALDNSGSIFITGPSSGNGTGSDFATIKYNSSGVQQWIQRYNSGGNVDDASSSIGTDVLGNCYVTGTDFTTIKYNSSGVQQWIQIYGGGAANSITVDEAGNCYLTGNQYVTIKYNTLGSLQWVQSYGPNVGSAVSIASDITGNVYITGTRWTTSTNPDYVTIKYSQLTGIQPVSSDIPKKYSLSQNYPNPFNPNTKIRFDVPIPLNPPEGGKFGVNVTLRIYDILGREVERLVKENLVPGAYEVNWDAGKYPSGVYIYMLQAGDFTETKKMILVK